MVIISRTVAKRMFFFLRKTSLPVFLSMASWVLQQGLARGAEGEGGPDPFYLKLLDEGLGLYRSGSLAEAAECLRIAAFGLLDDEPKLGVCYVYEAAILCQLKAPDQSSKYVGLVNSLKDPNLISATRFPPEVLRAFKAAQDATRPQAASSSPRAAFNPIAPFFPPAEVAKGAGKTEAFQKIGTIPMPGPADQRVAEKPRNDESLSQAVGSTNTGDSVAEKDKLETANTPQITITRDTPIGFITKIFERDGKNYVDADYIQLFTGDEATNQMRKDGACEKWGDPADPHGCRPKNGVYIKNVNPKIRTFELAVDAFFTLNDDANPDKKSMLTMNCDEYKKRIESRRGSKNGETPFYLIMDNDIVTRIIEHSVR